MSHAVINHVLGKSACPRTRTCFDFDWLFQLGDIAGAEHSDYCSDGWRSLSLPHDWSIEGPYSPDAPGGGSHGWAPGGIGWYRKTFTLPEEERGRTMWIEFDGVYHNSDVWLNGQHLGRRDYGYASFHYDLTPHLRWDGPNVLAVRVDNSDVPNCRWYSGSGIYRHVWLTTMGSAHVAHWGVCVTTPHVSESDAVIRVHTQIEGGHCRLRTSLLAPDGKTVGECEDDVTPQAGIDQQFTVSRPQLWSIEQPTLYSVVSRVIVNGDVVDEVVTPVGIRDVRFDKDRGFLLNGRCVKMKGICLHHDAGCVGAAVPDRVLERRLQILKELGGNAIRCSHNPPAPELLDMCDRMGIVVIDEAFDKWEGDFSPHWWMKQKGFAANWEQDLRAMLHRDRNHPCVVMWSVGNEMGQPGTDEIEPTMRRLVDLVRREEPTRPITAALFNSNAPTRDERAARVTHTAALVDVLCVNYQEPMYPHYRKALPGVVICGSEVFRYWRGGEMLVHSFDTRNPWYDVVEHDYVVGQFLWTGFDYLGESNTWPQRGFPSGIMDTCGFLKPEAWFHRSVWRSDPVVHIAVMPEATDDAWSWGAPTMAEHWNWPGMEKRLLRVRTYGNCSTVALVVNGTSYGVRQARDPHEHAIDWHVPYAPGRIEAIGREGDTIVARHALQTAGPVARIALEADRNTLTADGQDVAHVVVQLTDSQGFAVRTDQRTIRFGLTGPGTILGVDNGDMTCEEPYKAKQRTTRHGRCLVIVQAQREAGTVTLTATAEGLPDVSLNLVVAPVTRLDADAPLR